MRVATLTNCGGGAVSSGKQENMRKRILVGMIILCVIASAFACGDDDDAAPTATATTSSNASATAAGGTPSPQPTRASNRTGIAVYDKVIDATERGDISALTPLVQLTTAPCALIGTTRPRCPSGTPEGTNITYFPDSTCEPAFPEDAGPVLQRLIASAPRIVAVYKTDPSSTALAQPPGAVSLVFRRTGSTGSGLGWQLGVTADGHIVGSVGGCGQTPEEMLSVLGVPQSNIILGPLGP